MAAVYSAGDFRNGTTFEMEGNVYRVVEFQHVKPGKGSAFVRTKLKNVKTKWWEAPGPGFIRLPRNIMYPFRIGTSKYN